MRNNPVQRCDFRMLLDSTVIEKSLTRKKESENIPSEI